MSAPPGGRNWWRIVGITLVVITVVTGLAFLAVAVFVFIAIGSWGSNK